MSLAGVDFEAIAALKRSDAQMNAGVPARIFIGHQGPISVTISAPESS
jgi:hypothetical protein